MSALHSHRSSIENDTNANNSNCSYNVPCSSPPSSSCAAPAAAAPWSSPSAPVSASSLSSSSCSNAGVWIKTTISRLLRLPFDQHPPEATGLALDIMARATLSMSSLYMGPALLDLAEQQQQQQQQDSVRIYGFRPTSLLTNISMLAGLLGCATLPLFGALMDHTAARRRVGAITALTLTFIKALEMAVGPSTWLYVACAQVLLSILYNFHLTATYAYTAELTHHVEQQANYNSYFFLLLYVTSLLFLVTVLLLAHLWQTDNVGTARISQLVTAAASTLLFVFAWSGSGRQQQQQQQQHQHQYYGSELSFFRHRPALRQIPPGQSLWTAGFAKVAATARTIFALSTSSSALFLSGQQPSFSVIPMDLVECNDIDHSHHHRQHHQQQQQSNQFSLQEPVRLFLRPLQILLCSVALSEAAGSALITVSITYMKEVLHMTATEIGSIVVLVLLAGIPGSKLGAAVANYSPNNRNNSNNNSNHHERNHNQSAVIISSHPVRSLQICLLLFMTTTTAAALVLKGPQDRNKCWIFAVGWGLALAWLSPINTATFISLRPPGQEAEMMGLYLLTTQILAWLPPAVFTALNEASWSMAYGLVSINLFFVSSWILLYCGMQDYTNAATAVLMVSSTFPVVTTTTTTAPTPPLTSQEDEMLMMMTTNMDDEQTAATRTKSIMRQDHFVDLPSVS